MNWKQWATDRQTWKKEKDDFVEWTCLSKEDKKLFEAIRMFGKDWKKVTEYVGTRERGLICSHVQNLRKKFEKDGGLPDADIAAIL